MKLEESELWAVPEGQGEATAVAPSVLRKLVNYDDVSAEDEVVFAVFLQLPAGRAAAGASSGGDYVPKLLLCDLRNVQQQLPGMPKRPLFEAHEKVSLKYNRALTEYITGQERRAQAAAKNEERRAELAAKLKEQQKEKRKKQKEKKKKEKKEKKGKAEEADA